MTATRKIIAGNDQTGRGGRCWYIWDEEHRCYVNAEGQLRSGQAPDIMFQTLADAQRALHRNAERLSEVKP